MADNTRFHRQSSIISADDLKRERITVVGCGGIGSFTTFALAKLGCENIRVYDFDDVENHNLPNQNFRECDIGKSKVDATYDIVKDFTGVEIIGTKKKVTPSILRKTGGIVILAVDSMDARMELWEGLKMNVKVPLVIDSRMGAEVLQLYSFRPTNPDGVAMYEENLFPSSEALAAPCTAKSIIYTAFMVSALIAGQVKKFLTGDIVKDMITFDARTISVL